MRAGVFAVGLAALFLSFASPPPAAAAGLTDQNGAPFTLEQLRGRWVLLAFGYTHCPDVCPTGLYTMAQTLSILGPKADNLTAGFVSVDPERDTAAVLKDYLALFHDKLIGVTGDPAAVDELAVRHRVKYAKVQITPDHYAMDHTASFILVSPTGEQASRLHHGLKPEALADKLSQIMSRQ